MTNVDPPLPASLISQSPAVGASGFASSPCKQGTAGGTDGSDEGTGFGKSQTTATIAKGTTPSARTLRGLDWLNFFLADVQSGVGPFLAIYLAGYGWNEQRVGIALTVGGIAGILAQTPAGALVDRLHAKRALIAAGIVALALGALLIAFAPAFWSVMSAQVLIGGMSSVFGPAICAVSLGIVGHHLFDARQGRNQSFNSAGNVVAAILMGVLGYFVSNRSIFFFVALSTLPTILALLSIQPNEINYERARGAKEGADGQPAGVRTLLKDRPLAVMFHLQTRQCCRSWAKCSPKARAEAR